MFSQRGIEGRRYSVLFSSYLFERQRLTEWCFLFLDRLISVCVSALSDSNFISVSFGNQGGE